MWALCSLACFARSTVTQPTPSSAATKTHLCSGAFINAGPPRTNREERNEQKDVQRPRRTAEKIPGEVQPNRAGAGSSPKRWEKEIPWERDLYMQQVSIESERENRHHEDENEKEQKPRVKSQRYIERNRRPETVTNEEEDIEMHADEHHHLQYSGRERMHTMQRPTGDQAEMHAGTAVQTGARRCRENRPVKLQKDRTAEKSRQQWGPSCRVFHENRASRQRKRWQRVTAEKQRILMN